MLPTPRTLRMPVNQMRPLDACPSLSSGHGGPRSLEEPFSVQREVIAMRGRLPLSACDET
eukprot:9001723-Pyramimonas_sp.AAC.1